MTSLNQPGAKDDGGKQLPWLVLGRFARALMRVVRVGTFGAKKYTPRGWESVSNADERYREALWRHLFADAGGETVDPESGETHLAHALWNLTAVVELLEREKEG